MKPGGEVDYGRRNSLLHFGLDPHHFLLNWETRHWLWYRSELSKYPSRVLFVCFLWQPWMNKKKKATLKSLSFSDFEACTASQIADIWLNRRSVPIREKKPFLHFESRWKRGNFRRGWIYNFILTWLILHREVFVQEAACLIMVQLCLDWEQTKRNCTDTSHKRFMRVRGDVIVTQISWC